MQPIERKPLYINGEQIDCTVFSLIARAVISYQGQYTMYHVVPDHNIADSEAILYLLWSKS